MKKKYFVAYKEEDLFQAMRYDGHKTYEQAYEFATRQKGATLNFNIFCVEYKDIDKCNDVIAVITRCHKEAVDEPNYSRDESSLPIPMPLL